MNRTPTPWTAEPNFLVGGAMQIRAPESAGGYIVAYVTYAHIDGGTFDVATPNAAFIVHAVNNHETLTHALRELLGGIEAEDNGNVGTLQAAQQKARIALAQVKES